MNCDLEWFRHIDDELMMICLQNKLGIDHLLDAGDLIQEWKLDRLRIRNIWPRRLNPNYLGFVMIFPRIEKEDYATKMNQRFTITSMRNFASLGMYLSALGPCRFLWIFDFFLTKHRTQATSEPCFEGFHHSKKPGEWINKGWHRAKWMQAPSLRDCLRWAPSQGVFSMNPNPNVLGHGVWRPSQRQGPWTRSEMSRQWRTRFGRIMIRSKKTDRDEGFKAVKQWW